MKKIIYIVILVLVVVGAVVIYKKQNSPINHFSNSVLSFDFPCNIQVADNPGEYSDYGPGDVSVIAQHNCGTPSKLFDQSYWWLQTYTETKRSETVALRGVENGKEYINKNGVKGILTMSPKSETTVLLNKFVYSKDQNHYAVVIGLSRINGSSIEANLSLPEFLKIIDTIQTK